MATNNNPVVETAVAQVTAQAEAAHSEVEAQAAAAEAQAVSRANAEGADEQWLLNQFDAVEKKAVERHEKITQWFDSKISEIRTMVEALKEKRQASAEPPTPSNETRETVASSTPQTNPRTAQAAETPAAQANQERNGSGQGESGSRRKRRRI